jgi:threonine dehydratase
VRKVLTARVYDVAVETPLERAPRLSERLGAHVFLKREDSQPVFSFKLRGAFNKMARLDPAQRARGVICSSAGNHAQGVALAASVLGCKATICMPTSTPQIKLAAVRRLGGTVDLAGESYSETQAHAIARAAAEGLAFVPPYDDPYTIAGQGTIGAEILRQLPVSGSGNGSGAADTPAAAGDLFASEDSVPGSLDAVFVAIGGGGLAAGVAAYIKALRPDVAVFGVEPTGANAMAQSLAAGRRVTLTRVDGFADGVAVKTVGAETFRLCRELLDGVLTVSNAAISAAIKDVFNDTRSILEPAGAVAIAGAAAWVKKENARRAAGAAAGGPPARPPTVVAIASGANMNFDTLRRVSELADAGGLEEATLATTIPERPGSFSEFINAALGVGNGAASSPLAITELKYRRGGDGPAHVLWGAGVRSPAELEGVIERLSAAGCPTSDLSACDAAQLHLRHLVGGRPGGSSSPLPHETIYTVTFPERPGALRAFLGAVSPRWNVTLFHYRSAGTRDAAVLLGMQVPPADEDAFAAATASLGPDFAFEPLDGDARAVFEMFLN